MENSSTLPERLKAYREAHGLTLEQLGEMLGVTGRYVSMLIKKEKEVEESSSLGRLFSMYEANSVRAETPIESEFSGDTPGGGNVLTDQGAVYGARSKLRQAREAAGYSIKDFAQEMGYSLGVYQGIEDGTSGMGEKMIQKAAKLLKLNVSELMAGTEHPPSRSVPYGTFGAVPDIQLPPGQRAKFVPLLSMAECGANVCWEDGAYDGQGYLAIDCKDPKAFAVTLSGNSMESVYSPGDVALVYPSSPPRNGMLVIARLDAEHGSDVMFKIYQAASGKVTLSSYNPAYPPMEFAPEHFAWIYPVAKVTKSLPGFA